MNEGRIKVKIQQCISGEIIEEEVIPIYKCPHVNDRKYYPELKDVKFDKKSEYIIVENPNSCYGFSALWLKDKKTRYMNGMVLDIQAPVLLYVRYYKKL